MNPRRRISTGSPFEAEIGYSRAIVDGEWIFVSGTTGYDYATMRLPEAAAEQAENALATIISVLAEAGSRLEDVVRARYIVSDRAHVEPLFSVVGPAFRDIRPAATLIVAELLRPEMKVEIEVTARRPARP